MKFYDETKPLYIETDAFGVRPGAALLQTRSNTSCYRDEALGNSIIRPIAFMSRSLSSAEKNSNIERETLGILCRLKKFHHYLFSRDVTIITDYKMLVLIFKMDQATLSQRLQKFYLEYTNTEAGLYTNLDQIYS